MSCSSAASRASVSPTSLRETRASRLPMMRPVASTPTSAVRRMSSMSSSRASSIVVLVPTICAMPPAMALRVLRRASPRRPIRLRRAGFSAVESFRKTGSMPGQPRGWRILGRDDLGSGQPWALDDPGLDNVGPENPRDRESPARCTGTVRPWPVDAETPLTPEVVDVGVVDTTVVDARVGGRPIIVARA